MLTKKKLPSCSNTKVNLSERALMLIKIETWLTYITEAACGFLVASHVSNENWSLAGLWLAVGLLNIYFGWKSCWNIVFSDVESDSFWY